MMAPPASDPLVDQFNKLKTKEERRTYLASLNLRSLSKIKILMNRSDQV
jgi:hypothetical protein